MEDSLPLHLCQVHNFSIIINRSYMLLHCVAIAFLIHYRASFLFQNPITRATPLLPWLLVFGGELVLSFIWLVGQAYRWRPVSRTVFPERLPQDDNKFPAVDVFICTADPKNEPTLKVMNTVLSAMALEYPAEKLHVYLSDDGGSSITLLGMREAFKFARSWLLFCKRYGIKTICPKAYFSDAEDDYAISRRDVFMEDKQKIKEKYDAFKEQVRRAIEEGKLEDKITKSGTRSHDSVIEVIEEEISNEATEEHVKMPLLVYVSREKRPYHPHHFKAGALNALLRVSGVISNSPYILVLDCDMYCNDPTSAKQAMCFHLDPKISPSLAFVQFPQKFHNLSQNDIYDSEIRNIFQIQWYGWDGIKGPSISGTNFYIKREALYGISSQHKGLDLIDLKNSFGPSNEFLKSLGVEHKLSIDGIDSSNKLLEETRVLASCDYENNSKWGEKVGFMYHSLVEDLFTSFTMLHCKGWNSVYLNPSRPQFLGTCTTNLNDLLVQGMRWGSGLIQIGLSKFSPPIYGPLRMSLLQSMGYAEHAFSPLYFLPLWCFATIPQLCLLNDIPLYPQVSNEQFYIFLFIFLSALLKHLYEVGSIRIWRNEQRIWMIKSVTSYLHGTLNVIMAKFGLAEPSFVATNKADDDDEQAKRYHMGIFDFQTSTAFLAPLVTLTILNIISFVWGVLKMILTGDWEKMFAQVFLSFYILIMGYTIIEGMILRKDKGRIRPSITIFSAVFSVIFLSLGSIILMY